jgi:transposase-like protein
MEVKLREVRHFSTEFKKEKVELLAAKKITISELSRVYGVSKSAIYKWVGLFNTLPKGERIVLEKECEEAKNLSLLKKISELEGVIGRQQVNLLFLESVIECGNELLGEDLKKKFNTKQSK